MQIDGRAWRTIFPDDDGWTVRVIDQTRLPFELVTLPLRTAEDAARAVRDMVVRGAPLIGVTAAYGVALGLRRDASDGNLARVVDLLGDTRPTAVNLRWALARMTRLLRPLPPEARVERAYAEAAAMADEDAAACESIGRHGLPILERLSLERGRRPLNILTHCNAGWLACVDWGTALAPVYKAHDAGVAVHVWVDETRPRNQGASLTAYELAAHGVPCTVIADNAGGHLMQHGQVDACIVGTDRTTGTGDVANKIGTYLKALAAQDNSVPFYVALPSSTIDWSLDDGLRDIPIEQRAPREVTHLRGRAADGAVHEVEIAAPGAAAANPAFDVTPARLVTALITERGTCEASLEGLRSLFPDRKRSEA
jgi:methylthioribose-1-phosphate isomerase